MPKKKTQLDRFKSLTWNDLEKWAGAKVVERGKRYQGRGHVSELALTDEGWLIAWVKGSRRYATKVLMGEDGLPDSFCTCPYRSGCKHGVAVVIEYLNRVENDQNVPIAKQDDERLGLIKDRESDDKPSDHQTLFHGDLAGKIDHFLKGMTKAELISLIHELLTKYPEVRQDLIDRQPLTSGNIKAFVSRLQREIRDLDDEPGWRHDRQDEGHTTGYSRIQEKLERLLKAGHADNVLALGEELLRSGTRQVEESHDATEIQMGVADCMQVVVQALGQSSMAPADRLGLAMDAVLKDKYRLCDAFVEYLYRRHPKTAWDQLADQLLTRLKSSKPTQGPDDFSSSYSRDRLSDWTIHALERARRTEKIIPLCEAEARATGNYERLVTRLMAAGRYEDTERWIREGFRRTKGKYPGISTGLYDKLKDIRARQKDWPALAALEVDGFVRQPSPRGFAECKKAASKINIWDKVRAGLLEYLKKGVLPWKQKGWPLPETGFDRPEGARKDVFPMVNELIRIAIAERNAEQVLSWYDRLPRKGFGWYGINEEEIAAAVQTHFPDRAVAIWKKKAEELIAQVTPSAYRDAAKYLRKAESLIAPQDKPNQWYRYLQELKERHARKTRLMEILDGVEGKPIVSKRPGM